jgi:hypothetical protein
VSSRSDGAPVEEGSSVGQDAAEDSVVHQNQEVIIQQRGVKTRSKSGISKPKIYMDGTVQYSLFTSTGEPQTLDEAFGRKDWKKAMDTKYNVLQGNGTWHLVAPKKGKSIIDCKWVFKVKRKVDGSIDRYKARLVAKAFKQ